MTFPAYERYKKSDAPWIECIPDHWSIRKGRWLFEIKKRIAGKLGFDVLSITQKGIRIKNTESNDGQLSMDYSKYQLVEIGDFAMNHMDLLTGFVDLSNVNGVTSPDYRVFSIIDESNCNKRYFLYVLQVLYIKKIYYPYGQGSSQFGRWRLPTDAFKDFLYPYPSNEEQTVIANFLDRETAKIDALIHEQEKLIELLKEKRQGVISNAVCRGLDPNVPMKDSGVHWLGIVPERWEIVALKKIIDIQNGADHKDIEVEDGYPVIGSGGKFSYASKYLYDGESVLLGRKGTIDKPIYIKGKFWTVDTMYWSKIRSNAYGKFAYYVSLTIPFGYYSTKTALPSMTKGDLSEHLITIPDFNEQKSIANFLDQKISQIDEHLKEQQKLIELLKERRSVLISAAVTGQIDVREFA